MSEEIVVVEDLYQYVIKVGEIHGGKQVIFRFQNNYGASVVNHSLSYGIELAVIKFNSENNDDWNINYDTPITNDVIGYLDEESLYGTLIQIKNL